MSKKSDDQYSPQEAKERMKAALLGARLAGHVPMKAKSKKTATTKRRALKKKSRVSPFILSA
jgi:hypothetical protein